MIFKYLVMVFVFYFILLSANITQSTVNHDMICQSLKPGYKVHFLFVKASNYWGVPVHLSVGEFIY